MSAADAALQVRYRLGRGFRLQWEDAQQAHVLLFPEGMVKLNASAAQILQRCDGRMPLAALIDELQRAFGQADLADDVRQFVEFARSRGWIEAADADARGDAR